MIPLEQRLVLRLSGGQRHYLTFNEEGNSDCEDADIVRINGVTLSYNGIVIAFEGPPEGNAWTAIGHPRTVIALAVQKRNGVAAKNPKTVVRTNSSIGDILARRFERLGIVPVPGCPCKQVQTMLNAMSPSAVMSDLDGWATRLQRSARKWKELKGGMWNFIPSPPLWLCKRVIEDAAKEAQGIKSADEDTAL